jgi:DNA-directed RNA polymerase beta subunit
VCILAKSEKAIETPNLIEMQLDSYKEFLQQDVEPEQTQGDRPPGGFQGGIPDRKLR